MTKSIFTSKTAALSFVTALVGAAAFFVPSLENFVASNSSLILSCLGVIGFALRMATSGKVALFPGEE